MRNTFALLTIICTTFITLSCTSKVDNKQENAIVKSIDSTPFLDDSKNTNIKKKTKLRLSKETPTDELVFLGCKFHDGVYSASVDYNNSETGYSATYVLNVEVLDCRVVEIDFPDNSSLDDDHISAADLNIEGIATVKGEEGKTFEVQLDL